VSRIANNPEGATPGPGVLLSEILAVGRTLSAIRRLFRRVDFTAIPKIKIAIQEGRLTTPQVTIGAAARRLTVLRIFANFTT